MTVGLSHIRETSLSRTALDNNIGYNDVGRVPDDRTAHRQPALRS